VYPDRGDGEEHAPEPGADEVSLVALLAFADAVGSCEAAMRACLAVRPLDEIFLRIDGEDVPIYLDGRAYGIVESSRGTHALCSSALGSGTHEHVAELSADEDIDEQYGDIDRQLAEQLEPLLHVAYKMRATGLQDRLHAFIAANCGAETSLLHRRLLEESLLTPRVMAAANAKHVRSAWADRICSGPASGEGFVEVDPPHEHATACAQGRLLRPWLGAPAGTRVHVCTDVHGGRLAWSLASPAYGDRGYGDPRHAGYGYGNPAQPRFPRDDTVFTSLVMPWARDPDS
jgi:hypothetical protein